jgi:hypothetical protein
MRRGSAVFPRVFMLVTAMPIPARYAGDERRMLSAHWVLTRARVGPPKRIDGSHRRCAACPRDRVSTSARRGFGRGARGSSPPGEAAALRRAARQRSWPGLEMSLPSCVDGRWLLRGRPDVRLRAATPAC